MYPPAAPLELHLHRYIDRYIDSTEVPMRNSAHAYAKVHIYTHAYIHKHTHTHTHMHLHTPKQADQRARVMLQAGG